MITLLEVFDNGDKQMSLSSHSIKNVQFSIRKQTDFRPRLNTVAKDLVIEGLINTDLVDQEPQPVLDEYGDAIFDEQGNQQFDLLEFDCVRDLVKWAIIPEYCECYRDVIIQLKDAGSDLIKTKEYKNMFVVAYNERFDDKHGNGIFSIHLREMVSL